MAQRIINTTSLISRVLAFVRSYGQKCLMVVVGIKCIERQGTNTRQGRVWRFGLSNMSTSQLSFVFMIAARQKTRRL
jgi:hypothetical protein